MTDYIPNDRDDEQSLPDPMALILVGPVFATDKEARQYAVSGGWEPNDYEVEPFDVLV